MKFNRNTVPVDVEFEEIIEPSKPASDEIYDCVPSQRIGTERISSRDYEFRIPGFNRSSNKYSTFASTTIKW